ncbi:MAG: hypothetical protein RBU37_27965, partial [Myxococcota bacterium]|nr:hypothetical protein [Myxococcota bacterium]
MIEDHSFVLNTPYSKPHAQSKASRARLRCPQPMLARLSPAEQSVGAAQLGPQQGERPRTDEAQMSYSWALRLASTWSESPALCVGMEVASQGSRLRWTVELLARWDGIELLWDAERRHSVERSNLLRALAHRQTCTLLMWQHSPSELGLAVPRMEGGEP